MNDAIRIEATQMAWKDVPIKLSALANSTNEPTFKNTVEALEAITFSYQYPKDYFQKAEEKLSKQVDFWSDERADAFQTPENKHLQKITELRDTYKILNKILLIEKSEECLNSEETQLLKHHKNKLIGELNPVLDFINDDFQMVEHLTKITRFNHIVDRNRREFNSNIDMAWKGAINIPEENKNLLEGISEDVMETARRYTDTFKKEHNFARGDGYTFPLHQSYSLLAKSESPEFRKFVWERSELKCSKDQKDQGYFNRAFSGNYGPMYKTIMARAGIAKELKHKNFADHNLSNQILNSSEKVMNFLLIAWQEHRAKLDEHLDILKKEFDLDEIETYDLDHYRSKLRRKLGIGYDSEAMTDYFIPENIINGVFDTANKVFGLIVEKTEEPYLFDEKYEGFLVKKDGKELGLLYLDFDVDDGPRKTWCCETSRVRSNFDGVETLPIVTLHLLADKHHFWDMDDTVSLFHEFGHAAHVFLSEQRYPSLNHGGSIDFIELPSQLFEHWARDYEVLKTFAKNKDGEVLPKAMLDKWKETETFINVKSEAKTVLMYLQDIMVHSLSPEEAEKFTWESFEAKFWKELDVPKCLQIEGLMSEHPHIFGVDFHATKTHSYLFDEVIAHDIFNEVKKVGLFDKNICEKLVKDIYSGGSMRDAMGSIKSFLGREPDYHAFYDKKDVRVSKSKKRGLLKP